MRRKGKAVLAFASAFLALTMWESSRSHATTWMEVEKTDPISGTKCVAHRIVSFGTYIYQWPSKYDLVFWPSTDPNWFYYCTGSGYVSMASDFETLDDDEKAKIKDNLPSLYTAGTDLAKFSMRVDMAEKIYALRKKDDQFWIRFYRVLGYVNDAWDTEKALAYRLKALALIQKALEGSLLDGQRKEFLYLAGEYSRLNKVYTKAAQFFAEAKAITWADEKGSDAGENNYINELIRERRGLLPPEVKSNEVARWDQMRDAMSHARDEAKGLEGALHPLLADLEKFQARLQDLGKQIRAQENQLRRRHSLENPLELEYLVLQYNEQAAQHNATVEKAKALAAEYDRSIGEHNALVEVANALAKHIEEPVSAALPVSEPVSFAPAEPWRSTADERPEGQR